MPPTRYLSFVASNGSPYDSLREGEMFVVPKGVRHNPVAVEECLIMLVERKSTQHTGDIVSERTRTLEEQLRPLPPA